jgi:hypothetical protein
MPELTEIHLNQTAVAVDLVLGSEAQASILCRECNDEAA